MIRDIISKMKKQNKEENTIDLIDLDKIYIRTKIKNNWDSVSLKDLLDEKDGQQIWNWFMGRILSFLDIHEGEEITEEVVKRMVLLLEKMETTIYKLK